MHHSHTTPSVRRARYALTVVLAAVLLLGLTAPVATAAPRAAARTTASPFHAFLKGWFGHDRGLTINPDGSGSQFYTSGCCPPVSRYRFQLSNPRLDRFGHPVARMTITRVRIDRGGFRFPGVHVGTVGRAHVYRGHFFIDSLFKIRFCTNAAPAGACGA